MSRILWTLTVLVFLFPNISQALCVTVPKANLRSKPSTKSKVVWTVGKYMPLLEVARKGPWYKVKDVDGKQMWIYSSLVSSRIDCAVIRKPASALRQGPGKTKPKTPLAVAYKYTPFKKLEREGPWLHLQDDYGRKHWTYETNVWEALEYSNISY